VSLRLAMAWPALDDRSVRAWAEAAGVTELQARQFGPALRRNGLCRNDGTTAPLAIKFVAAKMASAMKARRPT